MTVGSARADVFNMPQGRKSLQFVAVGDPGNTADTTGYGSVDQAYWMGKYDVTTAQYCQFLNAVAKTDTYGVFNDYMATGYYSPMIAITREGDPGSYSYSVTGTCSDREDCPMSRVTWGDAARFCNWLQNGQPTGDQGPGTTEAGAYTLNGAITDADLLAMTHNVGAKYFIPSENQWYKAAFYKGSGANAGYWLYPTRSDTPPSNELSATGTNNANYWRGSYTDPVNYLTPVGAFAASPGPYGTYDMGGPLWQWNEAVIDDYERGLRGGDCNFDYDHLISSYRNYNAWPTAEWGTIGFRVASAIGAPEPGSAAMLAGIAFAMLLYGWRKHVRL